MQSFRTELENPIVEKDIIELEKKIRLFKEGKIADEKFRSLRLARGIYGQRQPGVQMIRIKIPQGKLTAQKLRRISQVSDTYSNGHLHITTRQDIQIHYVSLDKTPELWAELEQDEITLREACGNTVRNITASVTAGIDADEPFDVTPYAHGMFEYFLRNPICYEMGRKIKISFSANDKDDALSFIHDLGFIPKLKTENGKQVRGFKVMLGGGIGQQPIHAIVAHEFLLHDEIIPYTAAVLRVFDRYGERTKRMLARLKFLVKELGAENLLQLIEEERKVLLEKKFVPNLTLFEGYSTKFTIEKQLIAPELSEQYNHWLKLNVFKQKQEGFSAVSVKTTNGNISTKTAQVLSELAEKFSGDDLRLTISQNAIFRYVPNENLPLFFNALYAIDLAEVGFEGISDITACPGTDTCNLGVASSMGLSRSLEQLIKTEFFDLILHQQISIKISGCMNSCAQHGIADIGFQGMSINIGKLVAPAFQVWLGGKNLGDGNGEFGDKSLKIFSKRAPDALREILNDYKENAIEGQNFNQYYKSTGKKHYLTLLAPFADSQLFDEKELIDWGSENAYEKAVGVGECAGVMIDLVATLVFEAEEKLQNAVETLQVNQRADAIYWAYTANILAAKSLLVGTEAKTNSHKAIIESFDKFYIETNLITLPTSFSTFLLRIAEQEPTEEFATVYINESTVFVQQIKDFRNQNLSKNA